MSVRHIFLLNKPWMRWLVGAVALFFWSIPGELTAQPEGDDKVLITSEKGDGFVDLYVENKNFFDITLFLEVEGENFDVYHSLPLTKVVDPHVKEMAIRLYIKDKEESFDINTSYRWFMGDVDARHNDSYIYRLPYQAGEAHKLAQGNGGQFSHQNHSWYAVDFAMPVGTPVLAAREGVVVQVENSFEEGGPSASYKNRANYIVITHNDGTFGEYAHLRKNGVLVKPGDYVRKGQYIGYSGNTGYTSGPHLHFMVTRTQRDGTYQSLPVRFQTQNGIENLREGEVYSAVD